MSTDYNYGDNPYAHITSVVLSNTIQEVGYSAFSNCYDIKNISWGTGIVTIGDYAFSNCIYLSSVTIPSVTKSIGYRYKNMCFRQICKKLIFCGKHVSIFAKQKLAYSLLFVVCRWLLSKDFKILNYNEVFGE